MGIRESSRGGGVLFGSDVTATFLHNNSLQCLVRSHSEIKEGCACSHPGCYTVFSAPSRSRWFLFLVPEQVVIYLWDCLIHWTNDNTSILFGYLFINPIFSFTPTQAGTYSTNLFQEYLWRRIDSSSDGHSTSPDGGICIPRSYSETLTVLT